MSQPLAALEDWLRRRTVPAHLKRSDRDACRGQVKQFKRPTLTCRFLAEAFSRGCRHESTSQGSQRTLQIPYWAWYQKIGARRCWPSQIRLAPAIGNSMCTFVENARRCSSMCSDFKLSYPRRFKHMVRSQK